MVVSWKHEEKSIEGVRELGMISAFKRSDEGEGLSQLQTSLVDFSEVF